MSKKEQDELKEKLKKTTDESLKQKLNQTKSSEEALDFLEEQEEVRKKESLATQNQQAAATPKPMPLWANRAALSLAGFDFKKFDEKNFIKTLSSMGITNLKPSPDKSAYTLDYGKNKFVTINIKKGKVYTNDFSEEGFSNVAKLVKASGAHAIDMSQFIKEQMQAKNPHLDQFLANAFKTAKNEGITLVGMDEKQDLLSKLQHQSPMDLPTPKKDR